MNTDAFDKIIEIESRYPVETIEYEGIKIWPFLRTQLYFLYLYADKRNTGPRVKNSFFKKIIIVLKALLTSSLKLIFKKNSTVLFADNGKGCFRIVNDEQVFTLGDDIFEKEKKLITILTVLSFGNRVIKFHYMNDVVLLALQRLSSFGLKIERAKMINGPILETIIKELRVELNINKWLLNVVRSINFYRKWLRLIKPLKIYLVCYYDLNRMAASYAAKEMLIPVIELQHGTIFKKHIPYITRKYIYPNPYPDYLLAFGDNFTKIISPYIYKPENIFITGNYFIELMKSRSEENKKIFNLKYGKHHEKIIITVAGQENLESELLSFLATLALSTKDVFIIYIPRIRKNIAVVPGIHIETELNVYQCVQCSDITSTVYSTVAMESLALGTPVILININNIAREYLSESFDGLESVTVADTPENYLDCMAAVMSLDRNSVMTEGLSYYAGNRAERLKEALNYIEK